MITSIKIYPAWTVESMITHYKGIPKIPWYLISIWDLNPLIKSYIERDIIKSIGCKSFIELNFMDILPDNIERLPEYKRFLFSDIHAKRIINFLSDINTSKLPSQLIIHCTAGISRSGAVGVFACKYLGLDEKIFREDNPNILPNKHVLSVLNNI